MSSQRRPGAQGGSRGPRATQRRSATTRPPAARAARSSKAPTAAAGSPGIGERVADFSLPATGGAAFRLADARGRKLVLYFYPRDNTPGCTLEGRDFAQLAADFAAAGTAIVGISRDSLASHEKFREQMGFPFPLLSDTDERVCRQFDVIRQKHLYGRSYLGVERSTFLLDAHGVLRAQWRKVKVTGHARAVLTAAAAL
jgi:thioredoxin-dependent peroxiredoxin